MADKSITGLDAYTPGSGAAAHTNDVLVIVDTIDTTMAGSGTDKKLLISQFIDSTSYPCILDIALNPVAQGDLIYRDSVKWAVLAPGTSGYILATQGASANPHWVSLADTLNGIGSTQGDILYRGASSWGVLAPAPGTSGYVLSSGGASANPSWVADPVFVAQTAHYVLAGPTSAGPTAPTFRALAGADLPTTGLTITEWVGGITTINCTSAKTAAIDCTSTNAFLVNLYSTGGEHTFTLTNLSVGQTVKVTIIQGTTAGTVVWSESGQTIRWSGGVPPTLSTATSAPRNADTLILYSPASNVIGGTVALANF